MPADTLAERMRRWRRGARDERLERRALTIPPDSWRAWVRLAVWELWMGMLVCFALGLGVLLIASAPRRIVTVYDLSNCYVAQVVLPCERVVSGPAC